MSSVLAARAIQGARGGARRRSFVVEASLRLGPGPRLGSEEAHKTADLVVVLAESTNDNGLAYSSKSRRPRGCHVEKAREGTYVSLDSMHIRHLQAVYTASTAPAALSQIRAK